MRRTRIGSVLLGIAAAGLLAAGCGGGDEDKDPRAILEAALSEANQPRSGVINISGDITAEGDQGGDFSVTLNGPFQADEEGNLDAAQFDVELSGESSSVGGGLTLNGGLAFADDKLFITWQNQTYELDEGSARDLAPNAPSLEEADEITEEDREELLNALTNLENEGTEEIDGVETTHISAEIDLAEQLRKATDEESDLKDLKDLEDQVELDPLALDFYIDGDDLLRRVDVSLSARPGENVPAEGVDSIAASFTVALSELNEEQTIEVPKKAKPFEELFQNLGLGALGGLSLGQGSFGRDSAAASAQEELDAALEEAEQQTDKAVERAKKQADKAMAQSAELAQCMKDAAGDPEALQKCME